jgi:hypothetical protein
MCGMMGKEGERRMSGIMVVLHVTFQIENEAISRITKGCEMAIGRKVHPLSTGMRFEMFQFGRESPKRNQKKSPKTELPEERNSGFKLPQEELDTCAVNMRSCHGMELLPGLNAEGIADL